MTQVMLVANFLTGCAFLGSVGYAMKRSTPGYAAIAFCGAYVITWVVLLVQVGN